MNASTSIERSATTKAPGTVITFYSYKGGTGRSMALANVAWILASNGKRVLVIDWDLEAPGLHRYFAPFLDDPEFANTNGLIEFVMRFADEARTPAPPDETTGDAASGTTNKSKRSWFVPYANFARVATGLDFPFGGDGSIELVGAGRQNASYSVRVNSFDWRKFYTDLGGSAFLDLARQAAVRDYDYVLIDSRTGVSDTSGICTVEMPDVLVVCFTLNNQSIQGAAGAAASAVEQHRKLLEALDSPRDNKVPASELEEQQPKREPLRVFPVPMRVDYQGEKDKREVRTEVARSSFDGLPKVLTTDRGDGWRNRYWFGVEVAHSSYYSYEEVLATFRDAPDDPKSLLSTFERLTTYLTGGVVEKLGPLSDTDRATALAKFAGRSVAASPETRMVEDAEKIYADLPPSGQLVMQRLFTRLVYIGASADGSRYVAGSVPLAELGEESRPIMSRMERSELIRVDKSTADAGDVVRLVNDGLIGYWPRLTRWIQDDLAFLSWRQRLRIVMTEFERARQLLPPVATSQRDASAAVQTAPASAEPPAAAPALSPEQVEEAQRWVSTRPEDLSKRERRFIDAAIAEDAKRREAEAAQEHERQSLLESVRRRQEEERRRLEAASRAQRNRRFLSGALAVAALFVVGFVGLWWQGQRREQRIQESIAKGVVLAGRGQLDSALVSLDSAVKLDSNRADVRAARAGLLERLGNYPGAIGEWSAAIALKPDSTDLWLARGVSYARARQVSKALVDFDTVLRRNPKDPSALYQRGVIFSTQAMETKERGRSAAADSALRSFDRAPTLDSTLIDAYLARARLEEYVGDSASAASDYQRIVTIPGADSATQATARERFRVLSNSSNVPRLYVQFLDPSDRQLARTLVSRLSQVGKGKWQAFGPDFQPSTETNGEVRYFFAPDSALATQAQISVEQELKELGSYRLLRLQFMPRFAGRSRPGHVEVWLPRLNRGVTGS